MRAPNPIWSAFSVIAGFAVAASGQERPTDEWVTDPVDDATFATFLDFFQYEQALPFDLRETGSNEADGLLEQEIEFQSTPGVTVTARVHRPAGSTAPRGGVVLIHGGSTQGKNSPGTLGMARLIARAGWVVLAFDLMHWEGRATGLLETFEAQEKADRLYNRPSTYLQWVTQTVKDASRSYDLLVDEFAVDSDRIALVGFSRGGQLAMIAGGAEKRFAAVAMIHAGHFDALENGHLPAACGANFIGRINPRPALMINGENDTDYFPDSAVRPLQELMAEPTTIRWTEEGHGSITSDDRALLVEWLRDSVG